MVGEGQSGLVMEVVWSILHGVSVWRRMGRISYASVMIRVMFRSIHYSDV